MYFRKIPCLFILLTFLFFACEGELETSELPIAEAVVEVDTVVDSLSSSMVTLDSIPELTGTVADTAVAIYYCKLSDELTNSAKFGKAKEKLDSARSILLQYYTDENLLLARTYYLIGYNFVDFSKLDSAEYYFKKAKGIQIKLRGENNAAVADTYNALGITYYYKNSQSEAISNYERSIDITENIFGKNSIKIVNKIMNLGLVYIMEGQFNKALILYHKGLDILAANDQQDELNGGLLNINLGILYDKTGKVNLSEQSYRKAITLLTQNGIAEDHPYIATVYNNLALLRDNIKQQDEALYYLNKALKIRENSFGLYNADVADAYHNIGNVYSANRNYEQAIQFLKKALEIRTNLDYPDPIDLARNYNALAKIFGESDQFKTSMDYYKKAIQIYSETLRSKHPDLANAYLEKGNTLKGHSYLELADKEYINAHQSNNYTINQPLTNVLHLGNLITTFNHQGDLNYKLYRKNKDFNFLKKANNQFKLALKSIKIKHKTLNERSEKLIFLPKVYYAFEGLIITDYEIAKINNSISSNTQSFLYSEESKSLVLKESLNETAIQKTSKIPATLLDKEQALKASISKLEKKRYQSQVDIENANSRDSVFTYYTSKIFDAQQILDSINFQYKLKYPDYYKIKNTESVISISGVQDSLLSPNQALLEYFIGDSSIFTFTILKDTFYINEIKKDFPLEEWVEDMLDGIYKPFTANESHQQSATKYTNAAHQIYQKVFAQADNLLPENTELIIVPDGILGYIPFDALLVEAPSSSDNFSNHHYLLKDHQISYAYSATLLKEMQYRKHRKEPSKNLLAFAPSFNSNQDIAMLSERYIDTADTRNGLGALQYNDDEIRSIDAIIPSDLYFDSLATEERFTSMASDYRILHLSTHGKANDKVGDYSFLAFYEQDDSLENEWLYNRELYNLQLNADMVVLSACETGIGELQRGEGIISLARGFSYAGAKSIITTLWSVNDKSSKQLMEYFYTHLKTGKTKDAALRQAKLDYLENNKNLGVEPFFWAGYIPIGDMSPVELDNGWASWWIFALGGIILFCLFLYFWKK